MKFSSALIAFALLSACEGNHSQPSPEAPVVSQEPSTPAETPSGGWKTLNEALPSTPADLGPSQAERTFVQAARDYIVSLDLPMSVPAAKKEDPTQKAKLFVGLRCSAMLRKMKAAPKSFTNLYSDDLLGSVCSAKDIRLTPGQSVSSFKTTGLLFAKDRTSINVEIRPDFTVSAYRIYSIADTLISDLKATETIAVVDGERRIQSYRSGDLRKFELAEVSGHVSYSEHESYVTQTRDGALRKTLVVHGMKEGRTLMIREVTLTPAPGFLGRRREKSVGCVVQMLNTDNSVYSQASESALCLAPRLN